MVTDPFTCSRCGREHDLAELELGAVCPDPWLALSEPQRAQGRLTGDLCTWGDDRGQHFYVRCVLPLPIRPTGATYGYGVWASVSSASFEEILKTWNQDQPGEDAPCFGWLCTRLAGYPETTGLRTRLHPRGRALCPHLELEPTDHPLAVHQRDGIDRDELIRRLTALLHPRDP